MDKCASTLTLNLRLAQARLPIAPRDLALPEEAVHVGLDEAREADGGVVLALPAGVVDGAREEGEVDAGAHGGAVVAEELVGVLWGVITS